MAERHTLTLCAIMPAGPLCLTSGVRFGRDSAEASERLSAPHGQRVIGRMSCRAQQPFAVNGIELPIERFADSLLNADANGIERQFAQ